MLLLACTSFVLLHEYHLSRVLYEVELVYLSAVNADVQGTAKWIELKQTGNSCASVKSAFPAVVACYAKFLNLDITRQQQLSFNCMGNRLLGTLAFKKAICIISISRYFERHRSNDEFFYISRTSNFTRTASF